MNKVLAGLVIVGGGAVLIAGAVWFLYLLASLILPLFLYIFS